MLSKHSSRFYEITSAGELIVWVFIIRNTAIDHVMVTSPNTAVTCAYIDTNLSKDYVVGTGIGIMINPKS